MSTWSQFLERHLVDRAAILTDILARQHLRREARLPLLDVRREYKVSVTSALWAEHVEQHGATTRARVLDDLRQRLGREPLSAGGRWAIATRTMKLLRESFRAQRST